MSQYFSKAYERSAGNKKVESNFPNYATKIDPKNATCIDAFN